MSTQPSRSHVFQAASHAASRGAKRVIPEFDSKEREADVYLFVRPIDGVPKRVSEKGEAYQHWASVFHFVEDDSVRTLEGVEEDKKLVAIYTKQSPREKGKYYKVGHLITSPAHLKTFAYDNPANGKPYGVSLTCCQQWVRQLADNFIPSIVENLNNFHTLKEVDYLGAYVVDKKVLGNRPLS